MLFALTRSNLLRQLPDGNGIILRLTKIVTVNSNPSGRSKNIAEIIFLFHGGERSDVWKVK